MLGVTAEGRKLARLRGAARSARASATVLCFGSTEADLFLRASTKIIFVRLILVSVHKNYFCETYSCERPLPKGAARTLGCGRSQRWRRLARRRGRARLAGVRDAPGALERRITGDQQHLCYRQGSARWAHRERARRSVGCIFWFVCGTHKQCTGAGKHSLIPST